MPSWWRPVDVRPGQGRGGQRWGRHNPGWRKPSSPRS